MLTAIRVTFALYLNGRLIRTELVTAKDRVGAWARLNDRATRKGWDYDTVQLTYQEVL